MGKDLHRSIISFILSRIEEHSFIENFENISTNEHIMYRLKRRFGLSEIILLISDAYYFGDFDYLTKPIELNEGGIVLIAKPEAHFADDSQTNYIDDKVIVGKIGVVLGAIRKEEYWTYEKPKKKLQ